LRLLWSRLSEKLLHLRTGLIVRTPPDPDFGQAVCAALRAQVERLGLSIGDEPQWAAIELVEQVDPFSQEISLVGAWRGRRAGTLTLFPDGRVFAEYQVLLPCPGDAGRYVEAVQVWGKPPRLRGEPVIGEFAA
jgi:hypothetical protein